MTTLRHPRFVPAFAAAAWLALAPAANAHHSSSMYDRTKPVTIEGEVVEFQWVNPHAQLMVIETKPSGSAELKTWSVELTSPGVLTRNGWTKRTFNAGDRITLKFAPLRTGDAGGYFLQATLADGKVVAYSLE
jgi:hypothetical protein